MQPEDYLYHYADATGLKGILQSTKDYEPGKFTHPWNGTPVQCIWATNVRFLNDRMELRHALDLARMAIKSRLTEESLNGSSNRNEERRILIQLLGKLADSYDVVPTYVASFSQDGNDLAQWRSYGKGMGGYAIGFKRVRLQSLAQRQAFYLMPCIYEKARQEEIIVEIVDTFAEEVRRRLARSDYDPCGAWQDQADSAAFLRLRLVGALIKDSGFHVEKEWHLVHSKDTVSKYPEQLKLHFRPTAIGLAPYVHFRLRQIDEASIDALRVTVGPSLEPHASKAAIGDYLDQNGIVGTVECSSIPFRST